MRRSIWARIRYKRIVAILLITAAIAIGVCGIYNEINRERMAIRPTVSYILIPKEGDTLWGLCKNIDNEMDTGYLVWLAMKQNHLHNAGYLQPGREIVITLASRGAEE